MEVYQRISSLLGISSEALENLEKKLDAFTGRGLRFAEVVQETEERKEKILLACGLSRDESSAKKICPALRLKLIEEEKRLNGILHHPGFASQDGCRSLLNVAREIVQVGRGFYLKEKKARELIVANPPRHIMKFLGYDKIEDLLNHEKLEEIFAALRFVEDNNWLNSVFFKPYESLKDEDFEERPIKTIVLSPRWVQAGTYFVGKKLHHVSHLKELGVIFILPFENNYPGSLLEIFTLVLHYFHELDFYANLFSSYRKREGAFGGNIVKALSGKITSDVLDKKGQLAFRIVQRYLAKESTDDPRLYEPHVNPEAIHWARAINNLVMFAKRFDSQFLALFDGGDFVGKFFEDDHCCSVLVSFDLIDSVLSLTKESDLHNLFSYHQHEGLWNKLFEVYLGEDKLKELIMENLDKGHIALA